MYGIETREDNPVDTSSGYEWRYQKLQVIFFVVLRPCLCTCLKCCFIDLKSKHEERLIF